MRHYMIKGRWLTLAMLVFLVLGCSSKRDVFFRTVSNHPQSGGVELIYSYDGYRWYVLDSALQLPVVGDGTVKDPSITRGTDELYHVLWAAVKNGKEGIAHATSSDLKTWSLPTFIRVVAPDSTQLGVSTPRLFLNEQTDTCLVYWTSTRGGRERIYSFSTTDFNTFTPVRTLFEPNFSVQDPCLVCRAFNDFILIFKDQDPVESNLKVVFSNKPEGPFERVSPSFTAYQTRRPSVTKIGAKWLIYLENYEKNKQTAVTTLDFDSFEDISEEIALPAFSNGGAIFTVPRSTFKKLFRYLHCKPVKVKK